MLSPKKLANHRLLSLDAYRGMTMFLLLAEASLVYAAFTNYFSENSLGGHFIEQFHHHPWNGLRFWDLIQPFFMFIVGVAMPFSLNSRLKRGDSWNDAFKHILRRCFLLFLFGTGLHCVYSGEIVFELWNVLTQLSFTIVVAFLLMQFSWKTQLGASILILILAELLYRVYDPSAPFIKDQNFGSWLDMILMGKINDGGFVIRQIGPAKSKAINHCRSGRTSSRLWARPTRYYTHYKKDRNHILCSSFWRMGYLGASIFLLASRYERRQIMDTFIYDCRSQLYFYLSLC